MATSKKESPKKCGDLTVKQEKFCKVYIETGNATEAYRQCYASEKMSENAISVEAKRLLENPKISLRLKVEREKVGRRHDITLDSIISELNENRRIALSLETPQVSAANAATLAKAKLAEGWRDKSPTRLEELQALKLERELQLGEEKAQPTKVIIGVEDASKQSDA